MRQPADAASRSDTDGGDQAADAWPRSERPRRNAAQAGMVRTPVLDWDSPEIRRPTGSHATPPSISSSSCSSTPARSRPRGALAVMLNLAPEALARGVTAVSAGNHAIATAWAARELGITAKLVMLATANPGAGRTRRGATAPS